MGLDVSPNRPLTGLVLRAVTGSRRRTTARRGPYAPPSCPSHGTPRDDLDSAPVRHLCEWLLRRLLVGGQHVAGLADELAEDVVLWTPSAFAANRVAALETLLDAEADADSGPLTDVNVVVTTTSVVASRVLLEWRLTGRFTEPCFVEDDLLVEPSGQLVETAGTFVVTFGPEGVLAMHLYYDALALLEQLLTSP